MDKTKLKLLKYILDHCKDGYKVLDTQNVLKSIKKYRGKFELFEKDVNYLKQMNYIDLKYIDSSNFCLAIKDNTRIFQENLKIENHSKKNLLLILLFSSIASGIMSFVGAFIAVMMLR